ncbi:uncharacterized protein CTHT_0000800 [Thermochaetoides thermophila DSM 1495]|uniref:Endoplasmic reticulum lectin n=1 Tax=Chaetomium thermophilum (strain DSM 1495 / CBS 144.50 / IMI 039719) TaxID=759272 RepID=G0RYW4_CHATD|nr:hypothetical protein CTHT_0000800 [Thermochaetoides thermophila DSM 1495]EGS23392.1 hypothetical protein CTHT_0000800 [Thermochaetoides thermophila DSM 1495]
MHCRNLVLLASLQLATLADARQRSFSIHEDLLAHPQFEIELSNTPIPEAQALALLESSRSPNPPSSKSGLAGQVQQSDAPGKTSSSTSNAAGSSETEDEDSTPISITYELINNDPDRYLCFVPVVAPPPARNRTVNELSKAEEARELSRAQAKGWELMKGLEGHCMYFMSGWWSYSFCYGKRVVQYHAVPNPQGGPPLPDANTQEYILGRVRELPASQEAETAGDAGGSTSKTIVPPNSALQVKGDQRYLTQRLDDGTVCDLTGRPRTIEIQYHCSPNSSIDRIGWVKEVTTCNYVMLVYTPRLCADVAFLPPKETRTHPIRCHRVITNPDDTSLNPPREKIDTTPAAEAQAESGPLFANAQPQTLHKYSGMTIGGIVIGGRKLLGPNIPKTVLPPLPPPQQNGQQAAANILSSVFGNTGQSASLSQGKVLASKKKAGDSSGNGGKVEALSDEELKKLGLEPKQIAELRKELQKLAGERGWVLKLVEMPGGTVELIGDVDGDEEGESQQEDGKGAKEKLKGKGKVMGNRKGAAVKGSDTGRENLKKEREKEEEEEEELKGSKEIFFHEEL